MGRLRVLIVTLCLAGLALVAPTAADAGPPTRALPWLHVAHPAGRRAEIVDDAGRTILLRGVNVAGIEDDYYRTPTGAAPGPSPMWPLSPAAYQGQCPAMSHDAGEAPVCEVDAGRPEFEQSAADGSRNDFAQLRALGFDFVRLTLSWSQFEPTPGLYNDTYLDRIAQVVEWARQQDIYVLLDMHQDNYSRYTPETAPVSVPPLVTPTKMSSAHADGAPPWAVITEGEPALAPAGTAPFNAYVAASFNSFWLNRIPEDSKGRPLPAGAAPGPGLQDHYIGAMAALARRFHADSTVVGYEIMNEPLPGTFPPAVFSTTELYPFYGRVIDALTGAGASYRDLGVHVTKQAFFFEPMALRNVEDAPDQAPLPFSSYPGLVYAPHTYTHVFSADAIAGIPPDESPYPTSYDQAYEVADTEARAMNAALVVGEYGNGAGDDETLLRGSTTAQDKARAGSALWAWKGVCDAGASADSCAGIWAVYSGDPSPLPAQNGPIIPSRVKFLARVVPRATAGRLDAFAYDPDSRAFTMHATADRAVAAHQTDAETIVFIPATVSGAVTVSGVAVLDRVVVQPDGTRLAFVRPTAAGGYAVAVAPS
jgi:endoglycosylceramidase